MNTENRLACYGTLAPGRSNHGQLSALSGSWQPGIVTGTLKATGWGAGYGYPALTLSPVGTPVCVALFESYDLPEHWARLDAFEGADYQRVRTLVTTAAGVVEAWIYAAALPATAPSNCSRASLA